MKIKLFINKGLEFCFLPSICPFPLGTLKHISKNPTKKHCLSQWDASVCLEMPYVQSIASPSFICTKKILENNGSEICGWLHQLDHAVLYSLLTWGGKGFQLIGLWNILWRLIAYLYI